MDFCFALFRLPQLAFLEVLKQYGLAETILFSLCSKRTHRLMKKHRNKSDGISIKVLLENAGECSISRNRNKEYEYARFYVLETFKTRPASFENCIDVKKEKDETHLYFNWNDRFDGFKTIIVHLTELFEQPIYGICFASGKYLDRDKKLAEFVMSRQNTIGMLSYLLQDTSGDNISDILKICNPIETFRFYQDYSGEFLVNFPHNVKNAIIRGSVELTLDHLKCFNCHSFHANGTRMSMTDVNGFLKHWINGGCPELKYICLGIQSFEPAVLFDGIGMVQRDQGVVRTFKDAFNSEVTMRGGFDITRNDGRIAMIGNRVVRPFYAPCFEMVVLD